jgi:hypothetical protein
MNEIINDAIYRVVRAFTDPVIAFPVPTGFREHFEVPKWDRNIIVLERLEMAMGALRGEEVTATDAEAAFYLFTASLANRLNIYWGDIWGYVTTKLYRKWGYPQISGDLMVVSLTDDQMRDLNRLKRWIRYQIEARDEYRPTFYNRSVMKSQWDRMTGEIALLPLMFEDWPEER